MRFELPETEVKQYRTAFRSRDQAVRLDQGATFGVRAEKWFKTALLGRAAARHNEAMSAPARAQEYAERYVTEFLPVLTELAIYYARQDGKEIVPYNNQSLLEYQDEN